MNFTHKLWWSCLYYYKPRTPSPFLVVLLYELLNYLQSLIFIQNINSSRKCNS